MISCLPMLRDDLYYDLILMKQELEKLTIKERKFVLEEYIKNISLCKINIIEYNAFIELFNCIDN